MQLELYISDLLYRYECVTVPEFGSFLTQRVSAKIHDSTHAFYPPRKVLSFNEQINQNDGLLARYIANVEKIPFETATQAISKRVNTLKAYLAQGETLLFENIGELSLNEEGNLLFQPSYHLNYLTDAFGLGQFVSQEIIRETLKEEAAGIENVIPISVTPEKRKSRFYLRYAAVGLIALTLGSLGMSQYYVNQIEAQNQLAEQEAQQALEQRIQEATFVISNPLPAVTLHVTKHTGNYHIIAGAFRVEANALKKIEQLKIAGYHARIIGVNKYGLHEVVYESHETRQEALKALYTIKNTDNKDAWLLVKALD
ncbi:MAG TPA: SPOR domain-containing protein [Flavobacteriaceae bacterium]|nr:SPOR domain-containing protein [Flavobacteriaceae bacterium]